MKTLAELENLEIGVSVVIPGRGGWELLVVKCEDGYDFIHRNPAEGGCKFFQYSTVGNKYGAGMVVQEPSLGVACKNCGVEVDGAIVGAIVLDGEGKVTDRYSWSNIVFIKGGELSISGEGELKVNGEAKGNLQAVFLADKNRIKGYVGVFGPEKPETVKVLEMEKLLLASIY